LASHLSAEDQGVIQTVILKADEIAQQAAQAAAQAIVAQQQAAAATPGQPNGSNP